MVSSVGRRMLASMFETDLGKQFSGPHPAMGWKQGRGSAAPVHRSKDQYPPPRESTAVLRPLYTSNRSVTAPRLADVTRWAYFASTPRV
jgi:hypothetical protein